MRQFCFLCAIPVVVSACHILFDPEKYDVTTDAEPNAPDAREPPVDAAPGAPLIDRGLVVRYFIDEASTGVAPAGLADSAANPEDMVITYSPDGPIFVEDAAGNRGLQWSAVLGEGHAAVNVLDTSKLFTAFSNQTDATIEVVVQVVNSATGDSRITDFGENAVPRLSLQSPMPSRFDLNWESMPDGDIGQWTLNASDVGKRVVAHVVLDSTRPSASDRILLYIDGAGPLSNGRAGPDLNAPIVIPSDPAMFLTIGNRSIGGRSFVGTVFYVAMYDEPLTAAEVANNATALLADDDSRP